MTGDSTDQRPALRIVSGDPTPEEIAAITVVLAAAGQAAASVPKQRTAGAWADPALRLRRPIPAGAGAWRSSGRH